MKSCIDNLNIGDEIDYRCNNQVLRVAIAGSYYDDVRRYWLLASQFYKEHLPYSIATYPDGIYCKPIAKNYRNFFLALLDYDCVLKIYKGKEYYNLIPAEKGMFKFELCRPIITPS